MVNASRAYLYAQWCISPDNRKVGKYIKKQAAAWLEIADGKSEKAYVDEKRLDMICKVLQLIVHPDIGCSMYDGLEDYAWLLIVACLCKKKKKTGKRYYSTVVLEIARKNFKTFNSAIIFILLMLT